MQQWSKGLYGKKITGGSAAIEERAGIYAA